MKILHTKVLFVFLLAIFAANLIIAAVYTPMTYDEPLHIASGYAKFWLQDFRMNTEHPPLAHYAQGFFVGLASPVLDINHPSWTEKDMTLFSQRFFFVDNSMPFIMLFLGRVPGILLALALAVVVFLFASELYGRWAGILSIAILAFEPNMIAHGSVATTDMAFTAFLVAATYALLTYSQKPNMQRLVIFSLIFGLLQVTKYTAIMLAPVFFVLLIFIELKHHSIRKVASSLAVVAAITWFVINAAYFFTGTGIPVGVAMKNDVFLDAIYSPEKIFSGTPSWLVYALPSPLPYPYIKGLGFVLFESKSQIPVKLFDKVSYSGFKSYYFLAFLFKTPIPFILLVASAFIWRFAQRKMSGNELIIFGFVAFFFIMFSFTSKQIGIRHILPVYPLLFIFASRIAQLKKFRAGILFLVLLGAASTVASFPKPVSYYNEFVGRENGWKVFADSNTDWGQDVDSLIKYLQQNSMTTSVSVLTTQDFSFYNLTTTPVPPACDSGMHIASPHIIWLGSARWLSAYAPVKQIGTSIFVYNITGC